MQSEIERKATFNLTSTAVLENLLRIAPLIIWAAFIFIMSSSIGGGDNSRSVLSSFLERLFPAWFSTLSPAQVELINHSIRKLGHVTEYFIFGLCAVRAIRPKTCRFTVKNGLAALILSTIYACTDEIHQYFVPGRTAAVGDVLIDSFGASLAVIIILVWYARKTTGMPSEPLTGHTPV